MKLSRNANHWLPRVTAYVLVAVFRIMLPTRFRYPQWERLNKPSHDVVGTRHRPEVKGLAAEEKEHEKFQLMDCDGRYLLVDDGMAKIQLLFGSLKGFFFFTAFFAVLLFVTRDPGPISPALKNVVYIPCAVMGGITYGMQLLRIHPVTRCTVFDRYSRTVYFPSRWLRRELVCDFDDIEVNGFEFINYQEYLARAVLRIKPTVRRPWSFRPGMRVELPRDWRFMVPQMWKQIRDFMNTPIGEQLPGGDLTARVAAYYRLGLTIPEVRPPGKSRFAPDGFEDADWWRAVCYELKRRGQDIPEARVPDRKRGYDDSPEDGTAAGFLCLAFTEDPFAEDFTDAEAAAHGMKTERMKEEERHAERIAELDARVERAERIRQARKRAKQ